MTTKKSPPSIEELTAVIRRFVSERDWEQYHRPSALAVSAAVELGELLELFQWKTDEEVQSALSSETYLSALADEIADVMIYLLRLADVAGINMAEAIAKKMVKNAEKYPVERIRGRRPRDVQ
ncbi:MAG: nucleotide pyrophosphohydrolase [Candidatus Thorarchaeota archaeon]|nr:nucleotide pyrophosphohydrolase [Candidatus Thorarchaeota archaeon]